MGSCSCSSDGSTTKPGCILSVKGSPSVFCINAEFFGTDDAENSKSPGKSLHTRTNGEGHVRQRLEQRAAGDPLDYCNTNAYDFATGKGYVNFDVAYCGTLPAKPAAATTTATTVCQCQGCKKLAPVAPVAAVDTTTTTTTTTTTAEPTTTAPSTIKSRGGTSGD